MTQRCILAQSYFSKDILLCHFSRFVHTCASYINYVRKVAVAQKIANFLS